MKEEFRLLHVPINEFVISIEGYVKKGLSKKKAFVFYELTSCKEK